MTEIEAARKLLEAADIFYDNSENDPELQQFINMNDVWGWASAYGEHVKDEELIEVADLFKSYGWAGILYWVSKKNDNMRSEFYDNNRFIDFVANEERIKLEVSDYNKRAYHKTSYMLGDK